MYFNIDNLILGLLLTLHFTSALEYNKQQYNPNSDFLLHETGGNINNKDKVSLQVGTSQNNEQILGNQNYNAQFPSLGPSLGNKRTTANPNLSSSSWPQTPSNKRDYVAPQLPSTKPPQGSTQQTRTNNINLSSGTTVNTPNPQPSSNKRDYVSPQFPALRPQGNTQQTGKVKDLINLYDGKGKEQNTPQKTPSYSSILQGGTNRQTSSVTMPSTTKHVQPVSQPAQKASSAYTTPMSFSAVVAGSNKPGSTVTTPKPSTRNPSGIPSRPVVPTVPTSRPGVLPSSIVNNNKNNNQNVNSNGPSDAELQTVSEELLRKDSNNAAKYITINYQEKTTSQSKEDKAPQPLFTISPEAWNITTVQKFVPLLDNYERDTLVNEYVTPQERNEENTFMDAIMATTVIRHLMNFLKDKGYVTPDPRQQRDFLKQLWFSLYSRGKGKISSSGFEHIFVSELKNGEVSGLHNWVYFSKEEAANRINYLGYLKYLQISDKGVVMKLHFNQQGVDKPVDTMFIGTSPELEIALYTLCFVTRADNECNLKLGTKDVNIVTHTFRYRSKNLIGSAFPQI